MKICRSQSKAGFTLLEILVVMLIMVTMTSLIVPKLWRDSGDTLRSESIRFRNTVQWLTDRSLYSPDQTLRLHIDLNENSYEAQALNGETFEAINTSLIKPRKLDPELIKMVWIHDNPELETDFIMDLDFSTDGPEEKILMQFVSTDGKIGFSIYNHPARFRPVILDGLWDWTMILSRETPS
ncbi:MAG: prepilin-type N-terminal cleavage/methylation domain-containing protein [Magnetococcales bacterium]|nr:prepilin-type N-terminal cleavage/methylation domain-containing protein [Magnetococcales bacterium]